MNRLNKFANRTSNEGNLKTLTAVVSKYIQNLLQTLVKNFIYYRVQFCLRHGEKCYQTFLEIKIAILLQVYKQLHRTIELHIG